MTHRILLALLCAAPVCAEPGHPDANAPSPRTAPLVVTHDQAPVAPCLADCNAKQEHCRGQCLGNQQCFANCMTARDLCVAQCAAR